MADIFDFYVYDDRSIQFTLAEPIMLEDKDVTEFRFRIPKSLNGFDMSTWAWWFVYVNAKREKFSIPLTLVDDEDEPESFSTATFSINYGITEKDGGIQFALEVIDADEGGNVLHEWHTRTCNTAVIWTLQGNQVEYEEDITQDILSSILEQIAVNRAQIAVNKARIDNIASLPEGSTTADAELIDIRVGADGVTYPTAGDAVRGQITDLKEDLNALTAKEIKSGKVSALNDFVKTSNAAWRINDTPVQGDTYYYNKYNLSGVSILFVSGRSWGAKYPLIAFYDASDNLLGTDGSASQEYTNVTVKVPTNTSYCYVNGATYSSNTVTVSAYSESLHDIMVTSMASHVDVCRNNDVLTDANNAEVNSIYRLYFRWNETLLVDNLPITKSYSTMGTLFTFGEKSNSTAFRVQILIDDSDGIYFRYGTSNGYDSWHTIYDMRKTNYVVISATDDVIQKLIDANKDNDVTDVYFNDGDYDVIELYKRHYGSDFFDNYTGYDSGTNSFGRGLVLGLGKHYHFADQALFHAEYDGSNTNIKTYFSMFAPEYGGGFVVDGLRITACSGLRYAVHADFSTGNHNGGVGEFKNCYMNTSDRCIGAGLHNGVILKLEDSVFIQSSDIVPVHVHSPNTQGASGRLIVNGCYFSNRLQIGRGGSNTTKSIAIVSNSSLINLVNENSTWDVVSFNIDKR